MDAKKKDTVNKLIEVVGTNEMKICSVPQIVKRLIYWKRVKPLMWFKYRKSFQTKKEGLIISLIISEIFLNLKKIKTKKLKPMQLRVLENLFDEKKIIG